MPRKNLISSEGQVRSVPCSRCDLPAMLQNPSDVCQVGSLGLSLVISNGVALLVPFSWYSVPLRLILCSLLLNGTLLQ
jgi:hypothetical protein